MLAVVTVSLLQRSSSTLTPLYSELVPLQHQPMLLDKPNQTFTTLNPELYAHPFEAIILISLSLAFEYRNSVRWQCVDPPPSSTVTTTSYCPNYHFPTVAWPTSHNPLIFESSLSLPCRTTKGRQAWHWPIIHLPKCSNLATQSSLLPQCFNRKHEHSPNSEATMIESWNLSRLLSQWCILSALAPPSVRLSVWYVRMHQPMFYIWWFILQPFPPAKAIFTGIAILLSVWSLFISDILIVMTCERIRQSRTSAPIMTLSLSCSKWLNTLCPASIFILEPHWQGLSLRSS